MSNNKQDVSTQWRRLDTRIRAGSQPSKGPCLGLFSIFKRKETVIRSNIREFWCGSRIEDFPCTTLVPEIAEYFYRFIRDARRYDYATRHIIRCPATPRSCAYVIRGKVKLQWHFGRLSPKGPTWRPAFFVVFSSRAVAAATRIQGLDFQLNRSNSSIRDGYL